jgi:hypothetical protein
LHGSASARFTGGTLAPAMAEVGEVRAGFARSRRARNRRKMEGKGKKGALAMEGRARWPWHHRGGKHLLGPYHGENEGESVRMGWWRSRRNRGQVESGNGTAGRALDAGAMVRRHAVVLRSVGAEEARAR